MELHGNLVYFFLLLLSCNLPLFRDVSDEGKHGCAHAVHAPAGGLVPVLPLHGGFQVPSVGVWDGGDRPAGDSLCFPRLDAGTYISTVQAVVASEHPSLSPTGFTTKAQYTFRCPRAFELVW